MEIQNAIKTRLFGVSNREATFKVRGFHCTDPLLQEHLEQIGVQFLAGYHTALTSSDDAQLVHLLDETGPMYRGFAYEGAAMALYLLDRLSPFRKRTFDSFLEHSSASHTYMLHVGAGWALARLPFNPDRSLHRFHPLYRWLVIDGYGFHQAYFKTRRSVHKAYIPSSLGDYTKHAYCQGVGRAIWFVAGGQPPVVAEIIGKFPRSYHGDLWSGIGLACTYAGGVNASLIREIAQLAVIYHLHLAQGAVFGAKARARAGNMVPHTEMAVEILAGITATQASVIADETMVNVAAHNGIPAYEIWRKNIRQRLASTFSNKNQKQITDERIYS